MPLLVPQVTLEVLILPLHPSRLRPSFPLLLPRPSSRCVLYTLLDCYMKTLHLTLPLLTHLQTDSPWGALLRRTLFIPPHVDLSHSFAADSTYSNALQDVSGGFDRDHTEGQRYAVQSKGGSGDSFRPWKRHLNFQPSMNLVRDEVDPHLEHTGVVAPGQPLVFVSHNDFVNKIIECAESRNAYPDEENDLINIFVSHGRNQWHYKGMYCLAHAGQTPPGAFAELNSEQSTLVDGVLEGHSKGDSAWFNLIKQDWKVRLSRRDTRLPRSDFRTVADASLRFLVFTFVRWDDASVAVWRQNRGDFDL